jgi:PhnB protein
MRRAKSTPDGWHSVTPRLVVRDPALLVRFLKSTFDADGEYAAKAPSQMKIGDSSFFMSMSMTLTQPTGAHCRQVPPRLRNRKTSRMRTAAPW